MARKKKRPETVREVTYQDENLKIQERYAIERLGKQFVVRDKLEGHLVESGFDTSKQAWDWMCKTLTSELL
jgi:hypothetical protein